MAAIEFSPRTQERLQSKRNRIIAVVVVILLIILIVTLGVVLSRRDRSQRLPAYIMVPLYSYPSEGAWTPLENAVASHPEVVFQIIVNPADGPGSEKYPDEAYITALQALVVHKNVQLIGYVRTTWATRTLSSVLSDISTYSGWSEYYMDHNSTFSIGVNGIFFDEAPHTYTAEAVQYLNTINEHAKDASGILGNRTVIHNPGTIVDDRLDSPTTDVTVVFEESYDNYGKKKKKQLNTLSDGRSHHSYMVHSVPAMSSRSLARFVNSLTVHAEALFVTNLGVDYYKSFGSDWQDFVRIIDQGQ